MYEYALSDKKNTKNKKAASNDTASKNYKLNIKFCYILQYA